MGLKKLAIYYGYPSLVNEAKGDIDKAAQALSEFHIILSS